VSRFSKMVLSAPSSLYEVYQYATTSYWGRS
jgi:hypothetical protein